MGKTESTYSRTPVREALLRLEKEDFIDVYPRKGTIATDVTRNFIRDQRPELARDVCERHIQDTINRVQQQIIEL